MANGAVLSYCVAREARRAPSHESPIGDLLCAVHKLIECVSRKGIVLRLEEITRIRIMSCRNGSNNGYEGHAVPGKAAAAAAAASAVKGVLPG